MAQVVESVIPLLLRSLVRFQTPAVNSQDWEPQNNFWNDILNCWCESHGFLNEEVAPRARCLQCCLSLDLFSFFIWKPGCRSVTLTATTVRWGSFHSFMSFKLWRAASEGAYRNANYSRTPLTIQLPASVSAPPPHDLLGVVSCWCEYSQHADWLKARWVNRMGKEYCRVTFSISTSQIGFSAIADFSIHKRVFKLHLWHFSVSVSSVNIFIYVAAGVLHL